MDKSRRAPAEIVRVYGPFPGVSQVNGVSFDGARVWFASGEHINAVDPESGEIVARIDVEADAGTAFDGKYLYQIGEAVIRKVDVATGTVVATIPAPGGGRDSGLAWAEGSLWVGQYRDRRIVEIDPETGEIRRTIVSDRFVTGVTWVDGQLWHGTWEGDVSEVLRVDPDSGATLERIDMPAGVGVSGLEADGGDRFYCGGGTDGTIRAILRPPRD